MAKSVRTKKHRAKSNQQTGEAKIPEHLTERTDRTCFSKYIMVIGWLAMLVFTFHACTHMVAAGDTWVAMACGRHFVNHGVDTIEPFSANSHKAGPTPEEVQTWPGWARWITDKVGIETVKKWHPTGWINQNWLTHVIFYKLVPPSSYADSVSFTSNALVYWKFAIYIITVICVYYTSRLLGVHPALSAVFSCFAMFIGRSFLDIRPAGFSNMLVAVLLLVLALVTYRNVLFIWLIVPVAVFWCNVHGGYIYVFIMLIPFIGLHLMTALNRKWTAILYNVLAWPFLIFVFSRAGLTISTFLFAVLLVVLDIVLVYYKNNLVSIGRKGVYHAIAAYIVAFLAVIIFNPFHLTNLTHTFVISVSEHAARWREIHEWQPAFDWGNLVGDERPFLVMYIVAWLALAVWLWIAVLAKSTGQSQKRRARSIDENQWHKIDLPLMLIAALTIYMAIRSRRFIPIAAYAGCPVIAMLLHETICRISAIYNFKKYKSFIVSTLPYELQICFTIVGAAAVLFFGTWWGLKFKRVYLDPWPNDSKFNSVFMRMTASDAKPFYAMKFIKDNNLSGKMFNYWTEGGFIAWGQEPDKETGKTPLQLFMDGRAQAAYNRDTFDIWSYIMAGGTTTLQIIERAKIRDQSVTVDDYKQIGRWMDEQLTAHDVWLVLMPSTVFNDSDRASSYYAIRGLENDPNWPIVFFNDEQKIYVDVRDPRGRELFDGIFDGRTVYPDDYHGNLARAHSWLYYRQGAEEKRRGLNFAIEAFRSNPSPAPMLEMILLATNFDELTSDINQFCQEYVQSFSENKAQWYKQSGYRRRIEAARWACIYLEQVAQEQRNTALASSYEVMQNELFDDLLRMGQEKTW